MKDHNYASDERSIAEMLRCECGGGFVRSTLLGYTVLEDHMSVDEYVDEVFEEFIKANSSPWWHRSRVGYDVTKQGVRYVSQLGDFKYSPIYSSDKPVYRLFGERW